MYLLHALVHAVRTLLIKLQCHISHTAQLWLAIARMCPPMTATTRAFQGQELLFEQRFFSACYVYKKTSGVLWPGAGEN